MADQINYNNWTKAGLIQRVRELEKELKASSSSSSSSLKPSSTSPKCEEPRSKKEVVQQPGDHHHEPPIAADADAAAVPPKKPKGKRKMDPSRYSTRYIALKLSYLGKNYGGFEFQAMGNQPSIEEELWNALTKACLIFPEDDRVVDFDCCEYSKCGRTDRGVSAFGQVIGLRVRSNRPLPKERLRLDGQQAAAAAAASSGEGEREEKHDAMDIDQAEQEQGKPFDDILDEIPYPHVLNRILPKEIRILAWCPSPPPGFSARFSCRERQYRYFFTQPAFAPIPSHLEQQLPPPSSSSQGNENVMMKPGWLNIEAMRDAAKRYEGEHDFRNLCKVDPAKQITNFARRIFESDIVEVRDAASALPYLRAAGFSPSSPPQDQAAAAAATADGGEVFPKVYSFNVRGSAFLWHQIRHMVAILFLVGQGLEPASLVTELLDVRKNPCRPNYVMADEVPLVLWDCIFPADPDAPSTARNEDSLRWVYVGDDGPAGRFGPYGVMDDAWQMWREKKMDELLAGQLLQHISQQGSSLSSSSSSSQSNDGHHRKANPSTKVFEGGNGGRLSGKYVGVMKMKLLQSPEEQNDRYAKRKGFADADDMRAKKGFGRSKKEDEAAMADE